MECDDFSSSQVQAFMKLIYVSTLVFGEASSFLLPWKRVFKVSDAQVIIYEFLFLVGCWEHMLFSYVELINFAFLLSYMICLNVFQNLTLIYFQVEIAIRDNAKQLYANRIKSLGRGKYDIASHSESYVLNAA